MAARLESAFKLHFLPDHVRGEWYNVSHEEATGFVEEAIVDFGTWGITQAEIEERMMQWARRRHGLPRSAPVDECGLRTMTARSFRR